MFLMHKEGHKPSYTSFFLGPICGWKKNFKMCRSQRSLVVIVMMTMMVMMKILLEEKDILISDPISGGTDPDHCICLPSLTAIIILFHNDNADYADHDDNHDADYADNDYNKDADDADANNDDQRRN